MQKRENVVAGKLAAAVEEGQFDHEGEAGNLAAQLLDQLAGCGRGPARGQQVIHDEHALARFHRVAVNLERVLAIFEIVGDLDRVRGKLARLANRDEPSSLDV